MRRTVPAPTASCSRAFTRLPGLCWDAYAVSVMRVPVGFVCRLRDGSWTAYTPAGRTQTGCASRDAAAQSLLR